MKMKITFTSIIFSAAILIGMQIEGTVAPVTTTATPTTAAPTTTKSITTSTAAPTTTKSITCSTPALNNNSQLAQGTLAAPYAVGTTLLMACSTGYVLSGGNTTTACAANGTWMWSGGMLTCVQGCSAPTFGTNVVLTTGALATTYVAATNLSVTCATGYINSTGVTGLTCASGGAWTWTGGSALACVAGCLAPTLNANVGLTSGAALAWTYPLASSVLVKCATGYVASAGGTTATCAVGGNWTWTGGSQLTCVPGCLPPVLNTNVQQTSGYALAASYLLAQSVLLKCATGFVSSGGMTDANCTYGGSWNWANGSQLTCTAGCNAPSLNNYVTLVNGSLDPTYLLGASLQIHCLSDGYVPTSGGSTASCASGGAWTWTSGTQLTCAAGCLTIPTLNANMSTTARAPYLDSVSIQLTCDSGYMIASGDDSPTCRSNSSTYWWEMTNNILLKCILNTCLTAPLLNTGVGLVSTTIGPYANGTQLTVACTKGYAYVSGDTTPTCFVSNGSSAWLSTEGALNCTIGCALPTLNVSTQLTNGSFNASVVRGTTVDLTCSPGYVYISGVTQLTCVSSDTWAWINDSQPMNCTEICTTPQLNPQVVLQIGNLTSYYLITTVLQVNCSDRYVINGGSTSLTCLTGNTWQWTGGVALTCLIEAPYRGQTQASFKPSSCFNYTGYPARTNSLCLISCVSDPYCSGYSYSSTACLHNRPLLLMSAASMPCQARTV